jgi:hypothetical protein
MEPRFQLPFEKFIKITFQTADPLPSSFMKTASFLMFLEFLKELDLMVSLILKFSKELKPPVI